MALYSKLFFKMHNLLEELLCVKPPLASRRRIWCTDKLLILQFLHWVQDPSIVETCTQPILYIDRYQTWCNAGGQETLLQTKEAPPALPLHLSMFWAMRSLATGRNPGLLCRSVARGMAESRESLSKALRGFYFSPTAAVNLGRAQRTSLRVTFGGGGVARLPPFKRKGSYACFVLHARPSPQGLRTSGVQTKHAWLLLHGVESQTRAKSPQSLTLTSGFHLCHR